MHTKQDGLRDIVVPSNTNDVRCAITALWIDKICWAITDNTWRERSRECVCVCERERVRGEGDKCMRDRESWGQVSVTWPTHLQFYSVKLIEAGPGSSTGQPLEKLAHGQIVQSVRAVEHHALCGQSFGQVFHCLCLPSASRALGSSSKVQMEGTHKGAVAAVCQWGDDQPGKILVEMVKIFSGLGQNLRWQEQ